jgi:hypothetical protein
MESAAPTQLRRVRPDVVELKMDGNADQTLMYRGLTLGLRTKCGYKRRLRLQLFGQSNSEPGAHRLSATRRGPRYR